MRLIKTGTKRGNWLVTILLLMTMAAGVGLIAYPSFSEYWNSVHQSNVVMSYAENVAKINTEEYEGILNEARRYNAELAERGLNLVLSKEEKKEYQEQLNIDDSGIIGYIRIKKINVMLPIYHGTEERVLINSVGHLEGSSLPVGGANTHCILSGHRGLPSAKLFTDLDRLRIGDTFILTVLNATLTYEVDNISVVEPSDLSRLEIEEGQDYCTLVTCTPYGVNTHRLLVRGRRISNSDGRVMVVADAIQVPPMNTVPFIALVPLILMTGLFLLNVVITHRKVKSYKEQYLNEKKLQAPDIRSRSKKLQSVREITEHRSIDHSFKKKR